MADIFRLNDLDRVGMQCPNCKTEMIFEATAPLTVVVPQQCPACGTQYRDQGACVAAYLRLYQGQSRCSGVLKLYSKSSRVDAITEQAPPAKSE